MLAWVRTGFTANTAPVTFTKDGGRTFANATASGYFQYGLSSPMGGACITFFRGTDGVYGMQQWNPSTYAWTTYVPGFPTSVTSIYLADMNVNRGAWVGVLDSSAGYQMYTWTAGGIPFFQVNASASPYCSGHRLGAIGSLPSLGALAALAVPPYRVTLWRATGCLGAVDLLGGADAQVWAIASTSTHYLAR
jgi:hypothetical protein